MLTEKRLAELERAAVNALASYHEDCSLSVRASELAELCRAARYVKAMITPRESDSTRCPWCDGMRGLFDRFNHFRYIECPYCRGTGRVPKAARATVPTADFMALGDGEETDNGQQTSR